MLKLLKDILCSMGGCSDCGDVSTCINVKFAIMSMMYGLICILVDFAIYKTLDKSFLKLHYIKSGALIVFIFWPFGALAIGYVSSASHIINSSSTLAAISVGVSWPLIFARLIASHEEGKREDVIPPEAK